MYRGKGKVLRRRSVDNVMEELRPLKEQGYKFIRFMDDLFILSDEWVREFSEKYRRQIGLPFSCLVRANYVTAEIMACLKDAGCFKVAMGVEAGDDYVRNEILKRSMAREEIVRLRQTGKLSKSIRSVAPTMRRFRCFIHFRRPASTNTPAGTACWMNAAMRR